MLSQSISPPDYRLRNFLFAATTLLLLAGVFRVHLAVRDTRFGADEAFYATFARRAAAGGDWMLSGPLDKPPLSIYLSALAMELFALRYDPVRGVWDVSPQQGEFAVRIANVLASLIVVAVLGALARRLYARRSAGLLVLLLAALSPYLIVFGAAGFTDGLMLLCALLALLCVLRGHWLAAGMWLAAGIASKPQALLYLPLLLALPLLPPPSLRTRQTPLGLVGALLRLGLTLAVGMGLLGLWDAQRAAPASFWTLGAAYTNPERFVRAGEVLPRLEAFAAHGQYLLASALVTVALLLLALFTLAGRVRCAPRRRDSAIDLLLLTYCTGYFALHWLIAFPVYDRYLLPLVPPMLLLTAQGLTQAGSWLATHNGQRQTRQMLYALGRFAAMIVLLALLLGGAADASSGRCTIGTDGGRNRGIDLLADYLNSQQFGAIYYTYWLGFELDYYSGQWSDKRRVYYPAPDMLAADALLNSERQPRFLVLPAAMSAEPWLTVLRRAGFGVFWEVRIADFVVYRLIPSLPPHPSHPPEPPEPPVR